MTDSPIASAARRVAEIACHATGNLSSVPSADLAVLLPVLDAVAAGQDDDRIERWARGFVAAEGLDPDYRITTRHDALWTYSKGMARAAMALADAERRGSHSPERTAYIRDDAGRVVGELHHAEGVALGDVIDIISHPAVKRVTAERAEAAAERWGAYQEARETFQKAANTLWTSDKRTEAVASGEFYTAVAALDAAVRRLAGT